MMIDDKNLEEIAGGLDVTTSDIDYVSSDDSCDSFLSRGENYSVKCCRNCCYFIRNFTQQGWCFKNVKLP